MDIVPYLTEALNLKKLPLQIRRLNLRNLM